MKYWLHGLSTMMNVQSGQGLAEYSFIMGLVVVAIVGSFTIIGNDTLHMYQNIIEIVDLIL